MKVVEREQEPQNTVVCFEFKAQEDPAIEKQSLNQISIWQQQPWKSAHDLRFILVDIWYCFSTILFCPDWEKEQNSPDAGIRRGSHPTQASQGVEGCEPPRAFLQMGSLEQQQV